MALYKSELVTASSTDQGHFFAGNFNAKKTYGASRIWNNFLETFRCYYAKKIVFSYTANNDSGALRLKDADSGNYVYSFTSGTKIDQEIDVSSYRLLLFAEGDGTISTLQYDCTITDMKVYY